MKKITRTRPNLSPTRMERPCVSLNMVVATIGGFDDRLRGVLQEKSRRKGEDNKEDHLACVRSY